MVLFGSTTAPAAKFIVHSLPLSLIPVLRFGLACLCLVPLVGMKGGIGRLIRQDGWRLLLAAVLCVPLNQGFFLSATKLGLTSHVGLFYATCPLVVLLLAWGFRMERPDFRAADWGAALGGRDRGNRDRALSGESLSGRVCRPICRRFGPAADRGGGVWGDTLR